MRKKDNRGLKNIVSYVFVILLFSAGAYGVVWMVNTLGSAPRVGVISTNFGGRLHDVAMQSESSRLSRAVFVENFDDNLLFVRLRFREYLTVNGEPVGDGEIDLHQPDSWPVYLSDIDSPHNRRPGTDSYLIGQYGAVLGLGATEPKVYMPTFNHTLVPAASIADNVPSTSRYARHEAFSMIEAVGTTTDSIASDFSVGDIRTVSQLHEAGVQTGPGLLGFPGVTEPASDIGSLDYWSVGDTLMSPILYVDGQEQLRISEELSVHRARETKTPEAIFGTADGVITIDQWLNSDNQPVGNFWVVDTTDDEGWFYWAAPLSPGEATSLLLNEVVLIGSEGEVEYAVRVESDFVTRNYLNDLYPKISGAARNLWVNSVADVHSWRGFLEAIVNPGIRVIYLQDDIVVPEGASHSDGILGVVQRHSNESGSAAFVDFYADAGKSLIIEGNDHILDLGSIGLTFSENTHDVPRDITWRNVKIYSGNLWGFMNMWGLSDAAQADSSLTLHNVTHRGNMLTHTGGIHLIISGDTTSTVVSNFDSGLRETDWDVSNTVGAANIQVHRLTLLENSTLNLDVIDAGNIGMLGTNGFLHLRENATFNAIARGTGTEHENASARGINIDATNTNIILDEGAVMNLTPRPQFSSLSMGTEGRYIEIGQDAQININSIGHTQSTNGSARNIVFFAEGAGIHIDGGALNIHASNRAMSSSHVMQFAGNGSSFVVENGGILNIMSDGNASDVHLINFAGTGTSTFKFDNVSEVNLQRTSGLPVTGTNGLIGMAGTRGRLFISQGAISRWNRGSLGSSDYHWVGTTGVRMDFQETGTSVPARSSTTVSRGETSLLEQTQQLRLHLTTQNTQRLLIRNVQEY